MSSQEFPDNTLGPILPEKPWRSSLEEPYGIRRFNPNRSADSQAHRDMDVHPEILKYMLPPEPASPSDLDELIRVEASDEHTPILKWAIVDRDNEPVGWVQFYEDEVLPQDLRNKLEIPQKALVLEVSYSKLFNQWPETDTDEFFMKERLGFNAEEHRGVAVNGLRQALLRLHEMETTSAHIDQEPVFITAYTNPHNTPSEIVLSRNGFSKVGSTLYEEDAEELDNVWIKTV